MPELPQEFMILPVGASSFKEAMIVGAEAAPVGGRIHMGVSLNEGSCFWRGFYEGSCYSGSILGAKDFWKLLHGNLDK